MKIRTKIISLLALLFAVLIVLEVAVQRTVLLPSFAELERADARTSMKRIRFALDSTLDSLALSAGDWGNWVDVFEYIQKPSAAFVTTNMTLAGLRQLQVNMVLLADLQGRLVLAAARDLKTGAPLRLDLAAGQTLPPNFPWRGRLPGAAPAKGLVRTNLGIMLLAAAPVLDGSGAGPSAGLVIMGRLLNSAQIARLGAQAQAQVTLVDSDDDRSHERGADARVVESAEAIQVFQSVADIYGKPLLGLRVDVPREITARGRSAVTYASAYLIGAGAAVLALLAFALDLLVLGPLARMTRHAVAVGEGADLTARLNLPGRDEVAVLAREFDCMVGRVAESRRQLVDQSFEAGFAELAKGVMHNLGNAMTPLGVRLAKLSDGLRDIPVADVELAVLELEREPDGTARRGDLEQFLRLGLREVQGVLHRARGDVTVIQRQSMVVQTALAELMRSTRNEHVIEAVRLPDLVSQTLEIVPDACRQRLVVETDESLRLVGVVQVARTVLRLVLQNLIINAADAVRDAGREKGVLRVSAEIESDASRASLHLRCVDDGIGIATHDLERVFEQGFSTKPHDTNHGIGLHWCANAVAALGGRIWAASDGVGRGASLHLLLPLTLRAS